MRYFLPISHTKKGFQYQLKLFELWYILPENQHIIYINSNKHIFEHEDALIRPGLPEFKTLKELISCFLLNKGDSL